MRILMIEDDRELCEACAPQLQAAGFEADFCHDGGEALYYLRQPIYDLCILDRMLPGSDGLALLAAARAEGVRTPVLMLTAMGRVGDRVDGLDAGADDYLTKPFDMRELLARVRALARRPGTLAAPDLLRYGDLSLDRGSLALRGGKGACVLSKKEAEVLAALLQGGGRDVYKRQVVLFPIFVVKQRLFAHALLDDLFCDPGAPVLQLAVEHSHLQRIQGGARIAVGKICDHRQLVVPDLHRPAAKAVRISDGPPQQPGQILGREGLQHKHLAAGDVYKRQILVRAASPLSR